MWRIAIRFIIVAVAALAATPSGAQSEADAASAVSDPELEKLIRQLGDEDYTIREEATRAIIALGPDIVPRIRARPLAEADLEIRYRLRFILENIEPPDQAVLLVRAAEGSGLAPGDLITHVGGRRVRSEAELSDRLESNSDGAMLRVTGARGPREVGPVTSDQLVEMSDYQAPRGEVIAAALRLYADGFAELASDRLRSLRDPIPGNEMTAALRARMAFVAGDATAARRLLENRSEQTRADLVGSGWKPPSGLDLAGPGRAPFHLEWWLFTTGGPALYGDRSTGEPDLRVQRVLVPANRYVDAMHVSAEMWWTRYREALGSTEDVKTRNAGNMLAVTSWMLSELELVSECLRLVEPRSVILRLSPSRVSKWVRVRTDAWLPFFAGDSQTALDSFYDDARVVLQRRRQRNPDIQNPRIAAAIAFFLYQLPEDKRVEELLRVVNHAGQLGLSEYADWMAYALSEKNDAVIRDHLGTLLPTFSDAQVAPVARAVALLEYVQKAPDDDVFVAARHRLAQSPPTADRARWLAIVDALRHLSAERVAEARDVLAEFEDDADVAALLHTITFRLDPPPGADRAVLKAPLLAVPVGQDDASWLILARDRRLMQFDVADGALTALDRPTASWFPGPRQWPWIGRELDTGRVWVYARRRVLEVCTESGSALRLNIQTEDIPAFNRYAGPVFSTLADVVGSSRLPEGEPGEFLRNEILANAEFTTDPDLPEIGLIQAVPQDPRVVHIALRGGPHMLVDSPTGRVRTSHWLAEQLDLDSPPTFFAQALWPAGDDAARVLYLMSDQGLIRFDMGADRVSRIAMPGDEPFPHLIPESAPYVRRDPRWVYCARLPQDGGGVLRVKVADDSAEEVDMINEALPEGYYKVYSRSVLRRRIDRLFQASGFPALEEFVDDAAETVARWQKETRP